MPCHSLLTECQIKKLHKWLWINNLVTVFVTDMKPSLTLTHWAGEKHLHGTMVLSVPSTLYFYELLCICLSVWAPWKALLCHWRRTWYSEDPPWWPSSPPSMKSSKWSTTWRSIYQWMINVTQVVGKKKDRAQTIDTLLNCRALFKKSKSGNGLIPYYRWLAAFPALHTAVSTFLYPRFHVSPCWSRPVAAWSAPSSSWPGLPRDRWTASPSPLAPAVMPTPSDGPSAGCDACPTMLHLRNAPGDWTEGNLLWINFNDATWDQCLNVWHKVRLYWF